jgi:rfaE bifunctional protein kinase chain/domain
MKRPEKKYSPSSSVDLLALADYVEQFSSKTVVLFGDFVADEYQFGEISRVSREAPVLILRHRETHFSPGGGANAANNFAALGTRVYPVSAVGNDAAGDALIAHFRSKRVDISGVLRVKGWTTPTKTRFLAGWAHTVGQQVLRVDREPHSPIPEAVRKKLQTKLQAKLRVANALAALQLRSGRMLRQPRSTRATTFMLMPSRAFHRPLQTKQSWKLSITFP